MVTGVRGGHSLGALQEGALEHHGRRSTLRKRSIAHAQLRSLTNLTMPKQGCGELDHECEGFGFGKCSERKCTVLDSVWCLSGMTGPNNHWQLHVKQPAEQGKRAQWKKHDVHALKNTERRQVANQEVLNTLTASVFSPDDGKETLGLKLDKWVENNAIAKVVKELKRHLRNLKKLHQELAAQDQPESSSSFVAVAKTKDKTTPGKGAPSQPDLNLQGVLPKGITIEECDKSVNEGEDTKVKLGAEVEALVDKVFLGTCELKLDQLVGPERGKTASRKPRQGEVRKVRESMVKNRSVHVVLGALVRPSAPVHKENQTSLKRSREGPKQCVTESALQVQKGFWAEVIDGNHRRVALQEPLATCKPERRGKVTCNVFHTGDPEDNKVIRKHGHLVNEADKVGTKSTTWDAIAEVKTSHLTGPTRFAKEHIGDWKELTSSHSKGGCGATCLGLVVGLAEWSASSWNLLEELCNPGPDAAHDAPKDFKWISKVRGMDEKGHTAEIKKVASIKEHTTKQTIVNLQRKQRSKCLTSLFTKKRDLSSWGALCEKFQVPQNDKWLSFAIEFHLVKNKMAPEKNKRVIPDVALNSFQSCVDQCKARRTVEDAGRVQLKGGAIDLQVLTGVVVDEPGIVVQSKGKSMVLHKSFDDKTLNIHVNKIHAGKQLDTDRHITGNFTLTVRCLPENSKSFREIIDNFGHDDVDVLCACEHDRRPQKPETSFAPMVDAHIIAKNGRCARVDLGKSENLTITSSPKVTTVEGKSFTVDGKGDVMEHLCSAFCEERSTVLIARGGRGFDACALLHHTRKCTQLNHHRVIANCTKAKVQSMIEKDDPSCGAAASAISQQLHWKNTTITHVMLTCHVTLTRHPNPRDITWKPPCHARNVHTFPALRANAHPCNWAHTCPQTCTQKKTRWKLNTCMPPGVHMTQKACRTAQGKCASMHALHVQTHVSNTPPPRLNQNKTTRHDTSTHLVVTTDHTSSKKELFETKFNATLTKCSALHRFGNHWHDLGRSEEKSPDDADDDDEMPLAELGKKQASPTKGKGEKRPHTLRARVSPAKKPKTAKTVGKSIKRHTSDPLQCHFCERPVLPKERAQCAECNLIGHKACMPTKSTAFNLRFCSEDCKNTHEKIARDAEDLWTK
eukprot:jgi/Bigna1/84440/fgenesh1_pg.138_\